MLSFDVYETRLSGIRMQFLGFCTVCCGKRADGDEYGQASG